MKLYYGLPPEAGCGRENPEPMQISKSTDPCNGFLDIRFAFARNGKEDLTTVEKEIENVVQQRLVAFTKDRELPFSMRASFGSATTNYSTSFGTKLRVTPGLESAANNTMSIDLFEGLHTHLLTELGTEERKGIAWGQKVANPSSDTHSECRAGKL